MDSINDSVWTEYLYCLGNKQHRSSSKRAIALAFTLLPKPNQHIDIPIYASSAESPAHPIMEMQLTAAVSLPARGWGGGGDSNIKMPGCVCLVSENRPLLNPP